MIEKTEEEKKIEEVERKLDPPPKVRSWPYPFGNNINFGNMPYVPNPENAQ